MQLSLLFFMYIIGIIYMLYNNVSSLFMYILLLLLHASTRGGIKTNDYYNIFEYVYLRNI